MTDTNTAGLKALQEYLKDCDAHAIVPDVGGAWRAAFQAGRASLAASAGIACQCCGGSGEVFEHSEDCDDDLCALNGDEHSCTGVVRHCSCKASPIAVGATQTHIAAMERAWLWMDNQADSQSKGGHATFDLLMLREERDALRAAIDAAASAGSEPVAEVMFADGKKYIQYTVPKELLPVGAKLYTHPSPPEGAGTPNPLIARAKAEWHDDDGDVMWWAWNGHGWAGEAPWIGSPLSSDWPGYHTHWTVAPALPAPPASEAKEL